MTASNNSTTENTLPAEGFVRLPTVLAVFGIKKTALWDWIRNGRFPKGVKLGPRTTAWDVADLRAHMAKIRSGSAA